jgi:hypothetical protein
MASIQDTRPLVDRGRASFSTTTTARHRWHGGAVVHGVAASHQGCDASDAQLSLRICSHKPRQAIELAEKIKEMRRSDIKVFFCNSGSRQTT